MFRRAAQVGDIQTMQDMLASGDVNGGWDMPSFDVAELCGDGDGRYTQFHE